MPLCWCGERARGTGTRCARHRHTYNYNSDSTDISSVRRHIGTRARHPHIHFADDINPHARYDPGQALMPYTSHDNGYISSAQSNGLAQSVVRVLETSSDTHAIAMAEFSVTPSTGTYSFSARANLEREQCTVCLQWFPNGYKLECHQQEFPIGCEECRVCLRRDNVAWHADTEKHNRCFVRGCESDYRRFGNWKSRFVERHVKDTHYRGF